MTRDDVRNMIPGITEEQVTSLLNQSNSEIAKEKAKLEKYKNDTKADAERLKTIESENESLQAKLDELEQGNLTEIEKANKALEIANTRIAELEKIQFISNQRADAVANFKINAEQAKEVVKDDGTFDMVKLGQIMAEKESAAALAKEQEIAALSKNPTNKDNNPEDGSQAKNIALASAKRASTVNNDILDLYRR